MSDIKRKLIASFFFDCGKATNSMYLPICTYYHDLTNDEKPLQLNVKYAWQDFTVNYPINNRVKEKYLKFGEICFLDCAKSEILNRINKYKGNFEIDTANEFHFSKYGKAYMKKITKN